MIIGEIRRYLRDNNSIRVSRSLRDVAYKTITAREMMTRKNLKEPTLFEVAEEIGIEPETVTRAMDARPRSACTSRFTQMAETPSTLWIRSVTKRTARSTGSRISP